MISKRELQSHFVAKHKDDAQSWITSRRHSSSDDSNLELVGGKREQGNAEKLSQCM